jgi:hypothetical protein
VATPLSCPYCSATFTLADWSRRAECPACGRRVTFFEASGRVDPDAGRPGGADTGGSGNEVAAPESSASASAGPGAPGGGARRSRTLIGKPLVWTRGWTIVFAIWVVVAVLLFSARAGMGDLETFRPEDEAALDSVPVALMPDGETRYGDALATMAERLSWEAGERALTAETWYLLPRPWEERVYVILEVDRGEHGSFMLGWWVEDGTVTADPATEAFLEAVVAPGAGTRTIEYPEDPAFLSGLVAGRAGPGPPGPGG